MTKAKKIIALIVCTLLTVTIVACGKTTEEEKPTPNKPEEITTPAKPEEVKPTKPVEVKPTKPAEVTTPNKPQVVSYKTLYKQELDNLIKKYGKFVKEKPEDLVKGVKYAQLVDFDKDKVPEMIVIHDMKVLLYTIKDNKAVCIYEKEIGSRYGQTDVSYRLGINTSGEKVSLINYGSKKEWSEERISIVTVENGKVVIKELYAKAKENNDMPSRENLVSYYIDNKATTQSEYNKIYYSTVENALNIDACWNEEPATKSNLETFLSTLNN
ncbi:MAG: hypothetical protein ACRC2K_09425 [Clostridium sp.]